MTESPNPIVQEAESIVSAADAPSANSVEAPRTNEPSPSEAACPCGCNREETSCLFDEMPDEELLYDLADLFKVFADTAASRTSPRSSAQRKAPCRISCAR